MSQYPQFEVKARLEKLTRLVEVSLVINSTLQLESLLRKIMDAASELVAAESASILLMDQNTRELNFMAFASDSDTQHTRELKRIPVPLNNSIAGSIILQDKPIAINDVSEYPGHYRQADAKSGFHTDSLLGVPMRSRGEVIGVLEAVNKLEGKKWTSEDEYMLEILASQAAIAIENSTLVTKLTEAYEDLSQLDKMKNDFIAIASHELRTPLGVIMGYATFLKEESEGEASEHAGAVLNSAIRMRQIIEDMTNLRFLKLGERELEMQEVPVADVMVAALKDIQSMTEARGQELTYEVPPHAVTVHIDKQKLVMALTNLLNNAVKYSPDKGTIRLTHELHNNEIWIQVKDQGIGIPQDQLERIFEEFVQVEDHMTRRHNGMGLGLSIAKAIVETHQGRIWAESPGHQQGATFTLTLPLS